MTLGSSGIVEILFKSKKNYLYNRLLRLALKTEKNWHRNIAYKITNDTNYKAWVQAGWINCNCNGRFYFVSGAPNCFWVFEKKEDVLKYQLTWA